MAIASGDQLIAGLQAPYSFFKPSATSEGAGTWHSLWKVAGAPAAGSNPPLFSAGSGYIPDNTTTGSLPFTNPGGGSNTYLAKCSIAGATAGTLVIYDRLWTCSGFGTVVTTAQNITTPGTIPSRDRSGAALGEGVELWGEVYSAPGATGATWSVGYTDQDGNAATATYTHPANAESIGQMFRFTLAAGDTGVRAVSSFTASVSSGTAGDIGITLVRRIAEIPIMLANVAQMFDAFALGLPRIYDGSCLAAMVQCTATNTGLLQGSIALAQG